MRTPCLTPLLESFLLLLCGTREGNPTASRPRTHASRVSASQNNHCALTGSSIMNPKAISLVGPICPSDSWRVYRSGHPLTSVEHPGSNHRECISRVVVAPCMQHLFTSREPVLIPSMGRLSFYLLCPQLVGSQP